MASPETEVQICSVIGRLQGLVAVPWIGRVSASHCLMRSGLLEHGWLRHG